MRSTIILAIVSFCISCRLEQEQDWKQPGNNNPLVPGYFADPTVKKFDNTYYIYATTDGVKLASGEPTVWISKNLVGWYNIKLEIELPEGLTNCWAPDVLKGADGNYYYYMGNCQFGCNIYAYTSDNPVGPWTPVNQGEAVIPVGTGTENLPALDAQFLRWNIDDLYCYFGTWCHVFKGLGWAKIDPADMHTIVDEGFIPNEQLPELFEAVYPIDVNGKIILMYSAGDCRKSSYAVHYAYADHPTGPFTYGENNPLLESNTDHTIDGPGHNSVLEVNGQYYIFYHRHDNPHSSGGEFRQLAVDKLQFLNDSTIQHITPTHEGIKDFGLGLQRPENLAFKASVSASSYYHLVADQSPFTHSNIDHTYKAKYITDNNNGTLWKAASSELPQDVIIDLGGLKNIRRVVTEFEYTTYYYQYKIEISTDKKQWKLFTDKTQNRTCGSPMIDDNNLQGRYIKLTITGTEKCGAYAAIWNIKVYDKQFKIPAYHNKPEKTDPAPAASNELEIAFNADNIPLGKLSENIENTGTLKGYFKPVGNCRVKEISGKKGLYLDGESYLELTKKAPGSFNWNAPFTASAWVYNPETGFGECILLWNSRDNMLQASYAALMYGTGNYGAMAHGDGTVDVPFKQVPEAGRWHQITVTFDGMLETIYVDGKKDKNFPLNLFVKAGDVRIGSSGMPPENFTGYIANVQLYNKALTKDEVYKLFESTKP